MEVWRPYNAFYKDINTNKFVNKSHFDLQITVTFSFDNITLTENLKGYSTDSKIMIIEIVIWLLRNLKSVECHFFLNKGKLKLLFIVNFIFILQNENQDYSPIIRAISISNDN